VKQVLDVIAAHGFYFIDSRTSARTVGFTTARGMGIPAAERAVFIDEIDNSDIAYRIGKLRELIRLARERGTAIAIGHPNEETLEALKSMAREIREAGIEIVFASGVVS